ncbi:pyridoxal phosphate-dependent decarboxylase family protein [Methylibium sp.]|uniref:pyridoxal phosphate-dependent decarboxylase family protein n=1 Tax=Methylibium sp. TaxID=2067992 RepID=UPI003D118481
MPTDSPARDAALAMAPARFREIGHALVDRIAALMAELPGRPVTHGETPAEVRALLGDDPLPLTGADPAALLDAAASLLFDHSLLSSHPRFHGYIAASPAPIGVLAELLAAALNTNVALWHAAPVASEIEVQTVRWLAELVGYPAGCGGLLVSGGNLANLVALLAARRARLPGVREHGLQQARLAVYASAQTHGWLDKAVDIAGLGLQAVRWIPTDTGQRLDVNALAARIEADVAAGVQPLMAIGTAGTVSTGAIDPLPAMAALCRQLGLWFHVDGAYGAPAACLPDAPPELLGLREADSLALDPHKWLYAPIEAGCVLVREPRHLLDAFSQRPPYYGAPGGNEGTNFHELGPQNTRGFRALKVWLALRMAGRDGYRQMIGDDIALARRLHARVQATPRLEAGPGGLSIATLRYVPDAPQARDEAALDALNRRLLERLQHDGRAWLSPAVVDGRFWLRACIVNFRTGAEQVDALPALVVELGDALGAAGCSGT